ncbi:MAG: hypothetical protein, partial [Olavius algarvensis Gamma 1 endosymbiont]
DGHAPLCPSYGFGHSAGLSEPRFLVGCTKRSVPIETV